MGSEFCIETGRLRLRWLDPGDAGFIFRLVNDPQWLRYIGDKQVSNRGEARRYIESGPRTMYRQFGFGLNRVALKDADTPIGICGLLQRDSLQDCDLGFALLPEFRGQGFAREAAPAVMQHGFATLDMPRIAAIVSSDNYASIKLLVQLGFHREMAIHMEPKRDPVDLYLIHRKT